MCAQDMPDEDQRTPRPGGAWKVFIAVGVAAGLAAMVVSSRGVRRRLRQRWQQAMRDLAAGRFSLSPLHWALIGRSKCDIAAVLGPPPAAAQASAVVRGRPADFPYADIWYYPLDPRRQLAVAITFAHSQAKAVQWLSFPLPQA